MLNFKVGALRPASDAARATKLSAANDLVRETLSRHGLWTGTQGQVMRQDGHMNGVTPRPNQQPLPGPSARQVTLPDGAEFRAEVHSGPAGSRTYRHFVPASASDEVNGIVLMLHGCTQTPEDFAIGTNMNALAEAHQLVVIYPAQSRGANAQTCWNWFSRGDQRRGSGEPEILAGITRKVMAEHGVSADRVFVAGLSAGAAMAVILGETYPDIFAAVGAHSGLPFGAARDVPSAFAAMAGQAQDATGAMRSGSAVRSIIFHGAADRTVHPSNGDEIARRAGHGAGGQTVQTSERGNCNGRSYHRVVTSDVGGQILSEHWVVDGLGHAWSGGNGAGSYADPAGPDASAEMIRFFIDKPSEAAR